MKKWPKLKEHTIHMGMFDFSVNFVWGDHEQAKKYVAYKFEINEAEEDTLDFLARGKTFHRSGYCPIVWVPGKPKTAREYATLSHEMFHATCHLMEWVGILLEKSNEEVYAHAQAHLTYEALKAIR